MSELKVAAGRVEGSSDGTGVSEGGGRMIGDTPLWEDLNMRIEK